MKETLRRLAAWVMSLLMILNGLPVTALAEDAVVDTSSAAWSCGSSCANGCISDGRQCLCPASKIVGDYW